MNPLKPVDHAAIRTNQAVLIVLLAAAFVLNIPWLVGGVAFIMLAGSLVLRKPGFFWVYTRLLRPLKLARPDIIPDHPEPHLFAQGFGSVVLWGALVALLLGAAAAGWALVWLVIALASLNLFAGFCAGCFVYYWLNRLHLPGFDQQAPQGSLPGVRPRRPGNQEAQHVAE